MADPARGGAIVVIALHAGHGEAAGSWAPSVGIVVVAVGYLLLARGSSIARSLWFLTGCLLVAVALSPGFDRYADEDFGGHMAQHLLLGMVAPLALVLGAPVTLLLRGLPHRYARRLGRLLHSRLVRVLAHPVPGLVLTAGGLIALYFTPLYQLSTEHEAVHNGVHAHLLASGLLFSWAIAGPDPAAGRASVRVRLVVLGVAVAIHATVAQLVYAGLLVRIREPAAELQAAGSLMYFGGDIAELLLALAMLMTWRHAPGRRDRAGVSQMSV